MINAPFFLPNEKRYIRTRSPESVVAEMEMLASQGVKHVKIGDEMFVFKESHYLEIARLLRDKELGLNIWAYARVDTIKPKTLDMLKSAGFNWLGIGIESADPRVRDGSAKKLKSEAITNIVKTVETAGIEVGANYIFGLPFDTEISMRETLDLAEDLNTSYANLYSAMAYPGSPLYADAVREGRQLPKNWVGYSQHSFETFPLGTDTLTSADVLRFRDAAWEEYYTRPEYLEMIERKFGRIARQNIVDMTTIRLPRKILE